MHNLCNTGNIDIDINYRFFTPKKRGLLQHTVDNNKVSILARLALYENLLIGHEKSVRCLHCLVSVLSRLSLEKM